MSTRECLDLTRALSTPISSIRLVTLLLITSSHTTSHKHTDFRLRLESFGDLCHQVCSPDPRLLITFLPAATTFRKRTAHPSITVPTLLERSQGAGNTPSPATTHTINIAAKSRTISPTIRSLNPPGFYLTIATAPSNLPHIHHGGEDSHVRIQIAIERAMDKHRAGE